MRWVYSLITYVVLGLVPFYLNRRGKRNPGYLLDWHERFAYKLINRSVKPLIWIHGVSVGETRAAQKLVELLNEQFPSYQILFTSMTPTGRTAALKLFPNALIHYIAYDAPLCVKNFYKTFNPVLGLIIDTEIWPNLIYYAKKNSVPLYLVNARLSERSYLAYKRFNWFMRSYLNQLTAILAQDEASKEWFVKLGFKNLIKVIGNIKFDVVKSLEIAEQVNQIKTIIGARSVILLAATRDGEEELLINNLNFNSNLIYVIVPRHPERFNLVCNLLTMRKINYQLRSKNEKLKKNTRVLVGDSMGEMLAYSSLSKVVLVGGSFMNYGGQTPLDALQMGIPVIFGSSMYNFKKIADDILNMGCGIQINDPKDLNNALEFIQNAENYSKFKMKAQNFIKTYGGASNKIIDFIKDNLAKP